MEYKTRKYTREFKLSAVRLVKEQGYSSAEAAKSLGVDGHNIRSWVSRFGEGTSVAERQNRGVAVAPFSSGGVLAAGQFFGSPDFDPGAPAFRLTSLGSADAFVVLLTSTGALSLTP